MQGLSPSSSSTSDEDNLGIDSLFPERPLSPATVTSNPSPSPVTDMSSVSETDRSRLHHPPFLTFPKPTRAPSENLLPLQKSDIIWEEAGKQRLHKHGKPCWYLPDNPLTTESDRLDRFHYLLFPVPYLQDNGFRRSVESRRVRISLDSRKSEWRHLWNQIEASWGSFKSLMHLRQENKRRRIRSWVETGLYHSQTLEPWEIALAEDPFRAHSSQKKSFKNQWQVTLERHDRRMHRAHSRATSNRTSSAGSQVSNAASIKDVLEPEGWRVNSDSDDDSPRDLDDDSLPYPESKPQSRFALLARRFILNAQVERDRKQSKPQPLASVIQPRITPRLIKTLSQKPTSLVPQLTTQYTSSPSSEDQLCQFQERSRETCSLRAWNLYQLRWSVLCISSPKHSVSFKDVPWPLLHIPTGPESVTTQAVDDFILSPSHSWDKSRKERLIIAKQRWDPKIFKLRWSNCIKTDEWPHVRGTVEAVFRSLVDLENEDNVSCHPADSISPPDPQASEPAPPIIGKRMSASDVIARLVEHGCLNLTGHLDLGTFNECPVSQGGFSDVFRGRMLGGQVVAVKALRMSTEDMDGTDTKHFKHAARELNTWGICSHPNVLQLLGLAVFRGRIGMVSPWANHGTLPRYLNSNASIDRCDLCSQICNGLSYLHEIDIIHGDLKGANVLVLPDGTVVLSDFGNAKFLGRSIQFTEMTRHLSLSVRWAAPELLLNSEEPSKAADVYALGMTILEVITNKLPYDGKTDLVIVSLICQGKHPERPEKYIPFRSRDGNRCWGLLRHCWEYEPGNRPQVVEVARRIQQITEK